MDSLDKKKVYNIWMGIYNTFSKLYMVEDKGKGPQPKITYLPVEGTHIPLITKTDDELFAYLSFCVFNAGMKASVFEKKEEAIKRAFDNYRIGSVANFSEEKIQSILKDPRVIRNERKICSCVKNAKRILKIQSEWGSFAYYLMSYALYHGPNILLEDLQCNFSYIGEATGSQFLMDHGFDFYKADTHVRDILVRTGLIPKKDANSNQIKEVFEILKEAEERRKGNSDVWLRDIDGVLFSYGSGDSLTNEKGICRTGRPLCEECGASPYCLKNGVINR